MGNEDTKMKQRYLEYFKSQKSIGLMPLPYGTWVKQKKMGGSRQTQRQLETLSYGDAAELEKKFGYKK